MAHASRGEAEAEASKTLSRAADSIARTRDLTKRAEAGATDSSDRRPTPPRPPAGPSPFACCPWGLLFSLGTAATPGPRTRPPAGQALRLPWGLRFSRHLE